MALPNQIRSSIARQAGRVLQTGQRFKAFDQVRQRHFWSTVLFTPTAAGYIAQGRNDLFITPPGQAGQGFAAALTERETNWKSANRVPDNQNFEVLEVGVTLGIVPSDVAADGSNADEIPQPVVANSFAQNTVVAITYLTNTVELGLVNDFAQAAGPQMGTYIPYDSGVADTKLTSRFLTNGFAAPGLRRRLKVPILLQHGETFSFTYLTPRSFFVSTAWQFYARLDFWATESFVEKS